MDRKEFQEMCYKKHIMKRLGEELTLEELIAITNFWKEYPANINFYEFMIQLGMIKPHIASFLAAEYQSLEYMQALLNNAEFCKWVEFEHPELTADDALQEYFSIGQSPTA